MLTDFQIEHLLRNSAKSDRGFMVCFYKGNLIMGSNPKEVKDMLTVLWR